MSSYSIEFSKPALKQLSKIPQKMRQKVADEIGSLADDPGSSRLLKGNPSILTLKPLPGNG